MIFFHLALDDGMNLACTTYSLFSPRSPSKPNRVNTYANIFTVCDVDSNAGIMIFLLLPGYTRIISHDILLHHENIRSRNFHMNALISLETPFVSLPHPCPQASRIVSHSEAKSFSIHMLLRRGFNLHANY